MTRGTLPNFTYLEASSAGEALSSLRHNPQAVLKAGGTDLLVRMRWEELNPPLIINIQRIEGLREIIAEPSGGMQIGAMTTMDHLVSNSLVSPWHVLVDAARSMGTPQIRSLATVGGNVCSGSPVADMATALMAYGAMAAFETISGEKLIPVEELIRDRKKEPFILKQIILSSLQADTAGAFIKFTKGPGSGIPIVSCAVVLILEHDTLNCLRSRIVLGGVGPYPVRLSRIEEVFTSYSVTDDIVEKACDLIAKEIHPISDLRASAEYRIHLARVLLKRSCDLALQRRRPLKG